jgi:hypothetical protein
MEDIISKATQLSIFWKTNTWWPLKRLPEGNNRQAETGYLLA